MKPSTADSVSLLRSRCPSLLQRFLLTKHYARSSGGLPVPKGAKGGPDAGGPRALRVSGVRSASARIDAESRLGDLVSLVLLRAALPPLRAAGLVQRRLQPYSKAQKNGEQGAKEEAMVTG